MRRIKLILQPSQRNPRHGGKNPGLMHHPETGKAVEQKSGKNKLPKPRPAPLRLKYACGLLGLKNN